MNRTQPQIEYNDRTAGLLWCVGTLVLAWFLTTVLGDSQVAGTMMSQGLWVSLIEKLGGEIEPLPSGAVIANLSFPTLCLAALIFNAVCLIIGSISRTCLNRDHTVPVTFKHSLNTVAADGKWWLILLVWQFLSIAGLLGGSESLQSLATGTIPFWLALGFAFANCRALSRVSQASQQAQLLPSKLSWTALGAMLLFVIVFTGMNWQLFANLQTPHGDSAMYEEHLWNLTHGKGFRSYLDQGLFLGEHLQTIHLLLFPIYMLWPSHLLLELSEAVALGVCAIPVYRMTLRHTESQRAATLMAIAVLVYFPLHFLEISIDLKTFRPISYGVPLLLFTLDNLERKKYRLAFLLWLPLTLLAKEDFAAIFAPLGLWVAWSAWTEQKDKTGLKAGLGLTLFSVIYLIFVIKLAIPYFRAGGDVHYARYFGELGNSPGDIARSLFTQPGAVLGRLFSLRTVIYAAALLIPVSGLSLLSPSRLLVGLPLFGVLSLMQLSDETGSSATDMLIPFHHFHAPLVPIIFWSAAAGLGRLKNQAAWIPSRGASLAVFSGLATAVFFSLSPLGVAFWDPHSVHYWKSLYVISERAQQIDKVLEQIPENSRVASTDFIHPRFTHYERSYDYSQYARKVSGYELRVPEDTNYIVIDTGHRYSWIKSPDEIPELQNEPEKWELLPDRTSGDFLILKRRETSTQKETP
ncbi:DUF2079 domain-containing protein [Planctomycetaceae bacterium]|nr:DUF2079 domain-containing protein [Planctomycetaceae bacterium]MDC0261745.1 DUF2079 domain-containing protein [Planctomycetaceae bacterium]MDC0273469.1 DUF2079 domain-containing protein [Planctomycetaceae bacterium]MDC0307837.1 DUF2079 domain-containing protein [Planctomycetaceae bacterium]